MEKKRLSEYIKCSHDRTEGRENIEWANFWYSHANCSQESQRRILLVGDSTVRMIRSTFEKISGEPVDMLGVSYGLNDVLFINLIDSFFSSSKYQYSCIYLQLGRHSITNENGNLYQDDDYKQFHEAFCGLISYLFQYCRNVVLLSCFYDVVNLPSGFRGPRSSQPILLWRRMFGEKIDWSWSNVTKRKNEIIKIVAHKFQLKFCDINQFMLNLSSGFFPKYIHTDNIHYEKRARKVIVREYLKYL